MRRKECIRCRVSKCVGRFPLGMQTCRKCVTWIRGERGLFIGRRAA